MKSKILVVLFALFIFTGCNKNKSLQQVTIGAVLPLTGNAAKIGKWQKRGIELAVSEINKNNNIKVNVIFKDSMSSPKSGILAYRNLMQNSNVKVVISSLTSVSMAVQTSSEKDNISLVMLAVSHPTIAKGKKYTLRFNLGSEDESLELAKYLNQNNYKSGCIIYINNDFGLMATKVLEDNYKNIILANGYSPKSTDFRALSEKIISSKCEAINVIGYTNASILLIKQLRELGSKQDIFTNMALSIPSFQKLGGESLNGAKYTATNFGENDNIQSNNFIAKYEKVYKDKPTFFASFAYDALNFIYLNQSKNIPLITSEKYNYSGSIGDIRIQQGNLKTDVSINSFK